MGVRGIVTLLVTFVVALQLHPFLLWSPEALTAHGMLRDDSFFYGVMVRNYHELGFLTFDGEMATNGGQPLWIAVLILLEGWFPEPHTMTVIARTSFALYVAFAALFTYWLAGAGPLRGPVTAIAFAALVTANASFQRWTVAGLETPLLLLLVALLLCQIERISERLESPSLEAVRSREIVVLALVASLCFLARTDQLWLSVVCFAALFRSAHERVRNLLLYGFTTAAVVAPYLAYNRIVHGGLMPIHGRVKLYEMQQSLPAFADYVRSIEWHGLVQAVCSALPPTLELPLAARVTVTLAIVVPALGWIARDAFRPFANRKLPLWLHVLGVTCVAHIAMMYGWYRELRPYSSYYFTLTLVACGLAAGAWLALRGTGRVRPWLVGCLVFSLFSNGWHLSQFGPRPYWETNLEMASLLDAEPPEVTIGAYWPGVLAAFMTRPVIPLDGIVGSKEFFEQRIQTGSELEYLLERPHPLLALYLHRTPEALFEAPVAPDLDQWNRLGESRLWEYRHCPLEVVHRRPIKDKGNGWYTFRFGENASPECRHREPDATPSER